MSIKEAEITLQKKEKSYCQKMKQSFKIALRNRHKSKSIKSEANQLLEEINELRSQIN